MKGKYLQGLTFVLAVFMAFFFLAGLPAQVQAQSSGFQDLEKDSWYEEYVNFLAKRDIVKGYGSSGLFGPHRPVSRQEAAKMIALAASLDLDGPIPTFSDLNPSSDMTPFIAALAARGAVRGFPDGSFRPLDGLMRGHAAKMIVLAFGLKAGGMGTEIQDLPADPELGEAIRILASNGLVKGYGQTGFFRPDQVLTRAELSKILALSMVARAAQEAESIPSRTRLAKLRALLEDLSDADDQACLTYLEDRSNEVQRRVEEDERPPVVLTGMSIYQEPDRRIYEINDNLNLTGLLVRLSYSDGSSRHVSAQQLASYGITSDPPDGSLLKEGQVDPRTITLTHRGSGKEVTFEILVLPPLADRVDYLLAALNKDGENNAKMENDEGRVVLLQATSISGDLVIPYGVALDDNGYLLTIPEKTSLTVGEGGSLRLRSSFGAQGDGQLIVYGTLISPSGEGTYESRNAFIFHKGSQLIFVDADGGNPKTLIGGSDFSIDKGQIEVREYVPASAPRYFGFRIPQGAEVTVRGVIEIDNPTHNYVNSAHYEVAGRLTIDRSMLYCGSMRLETNGKVHLTQNVELKLFDSEQFKGSLDNKAGSVTGESGSKINFEAINKDSWLNGRDPDKAIYYWQGGSWVKQD